MTTPASGEISIQDIVDEFGGTAPHALSEYYGAADGVPASGQISLSDFYGKSNIIPAPVGLIVPYTSASAPTGWSLFTSANDKFLVGAGSTYASGATGGSPSASISGTLSTTGSHTGPNFTAASGPTGGGGAAYSSGGSHSHTFSGTATVTETYKNFTLIKCTTSGVQLPANAILLGVSSLSGLTNVETTTNRFIRAASSYGGTGGSPSISGTITSSSSGSHNHGITSVQPDSFPRSGTGSAGAHTHSVSLSGTLATKQKYLSAWTNASASYDLATNGIAMWESATPPSGWAICNGASGTPDLRDYFVRLGTTANHGTGSGDNTVSWSASAPGTVSHSHQSGSQMGSSAPSQHGSYSWSHTHTASGSAAVTQPYYAIYFIQYQG